MKVMKHFYRNVIHSIYNMCSELVLVLKVDVKIIEVDSRDVNI